MKMISPLFVFLEEVEVLLVLIAIFELALLNFVI